MKTLYNKYSCLHFLILAISFCCHQSISAQSLPHSETKSNHALVLDSHPIEIHKHVCELPASDISDPMYIPYKWKKKPSQNRSLDFTINYLPAGTIINEGTSNEKTCETWPMDAQDAFTFAMSIWSDHLENDQNIGVNACWSDDFDTGILGSAGAKYYYSSGALNDGITTYYPSALAEHIDDAPLQDVDIIANFNSGYTNFYFGTDGNTPPLDFDFVTVVLHELGHGLGFSSNRAYDDGVGSHECDGIAGHGCIGSNTDPTGDPFLTIFDRFITGSLGGITSNAYDNPSEELGNIFNGTSESLYFDEKFIDTFNASLPNAPKLTLYTPNPYTGGSTLSHLDEGIYPNDLMSPNLAKGQAIHDPGTSEIVFLEMGWQKAIKKIIYVDASKTSGANDGTSWSNAYLELQSGLAAAASDDEIWVAEGTYMPTSGGTNSREYTFSINKNIEIYGGFPNTGNPGFSDRDWDTYVTILSGDVGTIGVLADNVYNVVSIDGTTAFGNITSATILDGFTIEKGNANVTSHNFGAGILIDGAGIDNNCSPTIQNLRIINNYADVGGGMYVNGSDDGVANPTINNSHFTSNNSLDGGACFNGGFGGESSPTFNACKFNLNDAAEYYGGAVYNNGLEDGICNPFFVNCIFDANSSLQGDHIYNISSSPTITNVTLINNTNSAGIVDDDNSNSYIKNSIFYGDGLSANYGIDQTYNIIAQTEDPNNPIFINISNPDGADGIFGTIDDGIRLASNSPAIDMGVSTLVPEDDVLGSMRVGIPDIGAFEGYCLGNRIYVDATANGIQNGLSWTNAMTSLQAAIAAFNECGNFTEVWVAKGTYLTTKGTNRNISFSMKNGLAIYGGFEGNESNLNERNISSNVTILSGDLNDDDIISGNGASLVISNLGENSYHVISTSGLNNTAILDGFTIKGGNADLVDGTTGTHRGGGLYNSSASSPSIANCTFVGNSAQAGGGIYNLSGSNPILTNCEFKINIGLSGGGIYNYTSSPTIEGCTFEGNRALASNTDNGHGGGVANLTNSSPEINNCIFLENAATRDGGAIYNTTSSSPFITNCLFASNSTTDDGGGVFSVFSCSPSIVNCTFVANSATDKGGAVLNFQSSSSVIINSLFFKNTAPIGPTISNVSGSSLASGSTHNASDSEASKFLAVGTGFVDLSGLNYNDLFNEFSNMIGQDNIWRTEDDGFNLVSNAIVMEAGIENSSTPDEDIKSNSRINITDIGAYEPICQGGNRIYVNVNASGSDDGDSWLNAHTKLQDALAKSKTCGNKTEIWVAKGTYLTTDDGNREVSFKLNNGVSIYGGFIGTETNLEERDVEANPTILSADLNGDDIISGSGSTLSISGNSENAYHVILASQLNITSVLDGFTLQGGNADYTNQILYSDLGGGIVFGASADPLIVNCTFYANSAMKGAGAATQGGSDPKLLNCTFNKNLATNSGGGLFTISTTPTIDNCIFNGNLAPEGGGIFNNKSTSSIVTNSIFIDNVASVQGGAVCNLNFGTPEFTNCTFINNSADSQGGAIYNGFLSEPLLINNVFFDNQAANDPTIYNATSTFLNSSSSNNASDTDTILLSSVDPSFVNLSAFNYEDLFIDYTNYIGPDNRWRTSDDGLNIAGGSVLIDAGTANGGSLFDIAGVERIATPDIGAYEVLCEGITKLYVNMNATGGKNGSSWSEAYTDLQDAMTKIQTCDNITEIWVAQGTYLTTNDGARDVYFTMKDSVAIYGGFVGTEILLEERDVKQYPTILSADLDGDDEINGSGDSLTIANNGENAYHVISTTSLDSTAVLDGFTIRGGNAEILNATTGTHRGGGMYNSSASSPTVANCTFIGNSGEAGGGIYNLSASKPILKNCIFKNNMGLTGGGVYNFQSSPTLEGCMFEGNRAFGSSNNNGYGGGMANLSNSSPGINNCIFVENATSSLGGGIYNTFSSPTITNSTFSRNIADFGAGVYNINSNNASFFNCTYNNNTTVNDGGGIYNVSSSPSITNSTFSNNSANYGGGIANYQSDNISILNCTFENNTGSIEGGGIDNYSSNDLLVQNTVFFRNSAPNKSSIANFVSSININSTHNASDSDIALISAYGSGFVNLSELDYDDLFSNHTCLIGGDSLWMTADDGLHLFPGCVLEGAGTTINAPLEDITGFTRPSAPSIGAYETIQCGLQNTWTGPATGNWNSDLSHWSSGYLPQVCDNVIIPTGFDISILQGKDAKCNTLLIEGTSLMSVKTGGVIKVMNFIP